MDDILDLVIRTRVLGTEPVTVTGKDRPHFQQFRSVDIALCPISHHDRLFRFDLKLLQYQSERFGRRFSLVCILECDDNIEDIVEVQLA